MLFDKIFSAGDDDLDHIPPFPGPVTLYRSWKKYARLLSISTLMLIFISAMIAGHRFSGWLVWDAWFAIVFLGLGTIVFAAGLVFRGAESITLGPSDFETVALLRRHRVRWEDASSFVVWIVRNPYGGKMPAVMFDNRTKTGMRSAFSVRMSGHNDGIPDTYGLTAKALAELMNRWRAQALAAQSQQSAQNEPATSAVDHQA